MQKPSRSANRAVVLPSLSGNASATQSAPTDSFEHSQIAPTPTVSQRHGELVRRLELLGKVPEWSQSGKSVRLADGLEHFENWAGTVLTRSKFSENADPKIDKDHRKEIERRMADRSRAISAPPTSDPISFLKLQKHGKPERLNVSTSSANLDDSTSPTHEGKERSAGIAPQKSSLRDRSKGRASPKVDASANESYERELYDVLTPTRLTADKLDLTRDISNCASFQSDKKLKDMIQQQLKILDQIPLPSESSAVAFSFDLHESIGALWQKIKTPSSKPASRTEVIMLERWMNSSLENCTDKESGKVNSVDLQTVYSVVLYELIRQESLQCIERGLLMSKIWRKYMSFTYELLLDHQVMREKYQTMLDLNTRYSHAYPKQINQIESLQKQNKLFEDEIALLKQENQQYQIAHFNMQQEIQGIKKLLISISQEQETRQMLKDAGFALNNDGTVTSTENDSEEGIDHPSGGVKKRDAMTDTRVDGVVKLKDMETQAVAEMVTTSVQSNPIASGRNGASSITLLADMRDTSRQQLARDFTAMRGKISQSGLLFDEEISVNNNKATDTMDIIHYGKKEVSCQTDKVMLAPVNVTAALMHHQDYSPGTPTSVSSARSGMHQATHTTNSPASLAGKLKSGAPGIRNHAKKRAAIHKIHAHSNPLADTLIANSRGIQLTEKLKSLYWILRMVNDLYQEKIKLDGFDILCEKGWVAKHDYSISMFDFAFETFLQKNSRRSVAEKEMTDLLASANYHRHSSPRVAFFGILLGLSSGLPSPSSTELYFYTLAYFNKRSADFVFMDADRITPFVTLNSAVQFCADMLSVEIPDHLLKVCHGELKTNSRSSDSSEFELIKLDEVLSIIVRLRERSLEFNEELVRKLFVAGDVNCNGKVSWEEFRTMISSFDPFKTKNEVLSMFREVVEQGDDDDFDLNEFLYTAKLHSFFIRVPNQSEIASVLQPVPEKDFSHVMSAYVTKLWATERPSTEVKFVAALQNSDRERVNGLKERMALFRKRLDDLSKNEDDPVVVWLSYRMTIYEISNMMKLTEATTNSIRSWLQSK